MADAFRERGFDGKKYLSQGQQSTRRYRENGCVWTLSLCLWFLLVPPAEDLSLAGNQSNTSGHSTILINTAAGVVMQISCITTAAAAASTEAGRSPDSSNSCLPSTLSGLGPICSSSLASAQPGLALRSSSVMFVLMKWDNTEDSHFTNKLYKIWYESTTISPLSHSLQRWNANLWQFHYICRYLTAFQDYNNKVPPFHKNFV